MIDGYKIVVVTPIGRRKYIEKLHPYLLSLKGFVDQCVYWINTDITYDVAYVYSILNKDANFFSISGEIGPKNPHYLNDVYIQNNDKKTIYIHIADDICWFEKKALINLVKFTIQNPEHPFVYPLTINTGKTTMFHIVAGLIPSDVLPVSPMVFRKSNFDLSSLAPEVSRYIHVNFLNSINQGKLSNYYNLFDKYIIHDDEYIPMHCVAWMGDVNNKKFKSENLSKFLLTDIIPKHKEAHSCICGNSLVAHFSYQPHEEYLIRETDIYDSYQEQISAII